MYALDLDPSAIQDKYVLKKASWLSETFKVEAVVRLTVLFQLETFR